MQEPLDERNHFTVGKVNQPIQTRGHSLSVCSRCLFVCLCPSPSVCLFQLMELPEKHVEFFKCSRLFIYPVYLILFRGLSLSNTGSTTGRPDKTLQITRCGGGGSGKKRSETVLLMSKNIIVLIKSLSTSLRGGLITHLDRECRHQDPREDFVMSSPPLRGLYQTSEPDLIHSRKKRETNLNNRSFNMPPN